MTPTKLSQPAFVPQDSGIELAGSGDARHCDGDHPPSALRPHRRSTKSRSRGASSSSHTRASCSPTSWPATAPGNPSCRRISAEWRSRRPGSVAVSNEDVRGRATVEQPGVSSGGGRVREPGRRRRITSQNAVAANPSLARHAARHSAIRGGSMSPTPPPPIADPEDLLGTYAFLPWLRQGLANAITAPPATGTRATIHVEVDVTGTPVGGGASLQQSAAQDIALYGPGDILGIDPRAVIRTEPRAGVSNFESNYLAAIDFYDEDFPVALHAGARRGAAA